MPVLPSCEGTPTPNGLVTATILFADYLPVGTYQYRYQIHLTSAGSYHALPTTIRETYFPDIYGKGAGQLYKISSH